MSRKRGMFFKANNYIKKLKNYVYLPTLKGNNKNTQKICKKECPKENRLPSREKYAEQVVRIIKEYHGKGEESFIFGLSGKWGSGKTTFLDILRNKLENPSKGEKFTVLSISPWKFGSNSTAFLRHFLRTLNKELINKYTSNKSAIYRFKYQFKNKKLLENLDRDVTIPYLDTSKGFLLVVAAIVISFLIYKFLVSIEIVPWSFVLWLNIGNISILKTALKAIFILIALPIVLGQLKFTTQNKQINTLDGFDKLYKSILDELCLKNIVIFVDDLDRVSPETARKVLDALRTFFDKPNVTFIVTGDHTVLENHIGEQVKNFSGNADKREEGRRYLKKMFNVYWPLPIPTTQEFKLFLNSELDNKKSKLNKILSEDDKKKLSDWLLKYFDKNFRNIIRFLETIIFNFGLVDTQLKTADKDLKVQLEDVKNNPMLFVRILMIQELAAPLYEEYLKTPTLINDIETDLINSKNNELEKTIINLKEKSSISLQQEIFIKKFIYEKPRFYQENLGLIVHSIEPFIYLASSSDFSDVKGPTANDFIRYVNNQNESNIIAGLENSGSKKIIEFVQEVNKLLLDQLANDQSSFLKTLNTVITSLAKTNSDSLAQGYFFDAFTKIDLSNIMTSSRPLDERMTILLCFSNWLDRFPKEKDLQHFLNKFKINDSLLDQIETYAVQLSKFGNFTSKLFIEWIVFLFSLDTNRALQVTESILEKIEIEYLKKLVTIEEDITNIAANSPDSENGKIAFSIIKKLENEHINSLFSKKIIENVKVGKFNVTNWIANNKLELEGIVSNDEIKNAVIELIKQYVDDDNNLINTVTNNSAIVYLYINEIWGELIKAENPSLFKLIKLISGNAGMIPIVPTEKIAIKIVEKIINESSKIDNETEEAELLKLLTKSNLWNNMSNLPFKKRLSPKRNKKSKKPMVKQVVEEVFESWQI